MVACGLRFDWNVPREVLERCFLLLPYVVAIKYLFLYRFDVPRFAWRYVGLREVTRIFYALSSASAFLLLVRFVAVPMRKHARWLDETWIPTGIILIDFILAFCAIVGIRALRRVHSERRRRAFLSSGPSSEVEAVPTLLIGAGQAGLAVARDIYRHPNLRIKPVGFLDDDRLKVGTILHGIPVLAGTASLAEVVKTTGAKQVLITFAATSGKQIRDLVDLCDRASVKAKIIPGLHEIVGGHVNLSRVRDIAIEDLLRREPVALDGEAISDAIRGRTVLVTGAGGSIGSELCRQICRFSPKRLVLVEQAENALFEIHRELLRTVPEVDLIPVIGDITDDRRMRATFTKHAPEIVLHAAAHKHVPMMEYNPGEAIKNNVFGTQTVADISDELGVERFVMISTDKAVNPTSIMGASKRAAELYIQALSARSKTKFVAVRFGNVLGSAGSVIPLFQEQIARGGPLTVTHPEMRRYFMTIPEASQLVLQAATMGDGGEIFILDMGEPVRIVDLARDLVKLSGLRPDEDIEIQFTGMRPGEKLFEELSVANENANKTRHAKIFVGNLSPVSLPRLLDQLAQLAREADGEPEAVRARLAAIVPEFGATSEPLPSGPEPSEASRPSLRPMPVLAAERG
ncbi:MAG: polysaccharide biosynthesis protein [Polyangiaceae bacterium]|nr:polysaccharide biosynthesis protein [Polyangiaceae bacterium]